MMKIGIDIRSVCGRKTGKGWYTYHLVRELLALDLSNEYLLYTNAISGDVGKMIAIAAQASKIHIKIIHKNPLLWHLAVIRDFARAGGNLFFAPTSFIIPAFLPRRIVSVITVHDLIAFLHPHFHQTKATVLEHLFFRMALRKTRSVLVPSENTKKDLIRMFKYPEEKIAVTPLGVEIGVGKNTSTEALKTMKEKYKLPEKYILTVSGLEPRKNISVLLDAVNELAKKHAHIALVIVGGKGWKSEATQEKVRAAGSRVLHIENCDSADLSAIYAGAKLFVFPSLYEGFGLPPLEAMAAGCPVVCSNAASLPEVVGNCALLFDPRRPTELQMQIEKILANPELREDLINRGKKRAAEFTWKRTAEKTFAGFKKVISDE